jgi:hypothetical protein
MQRFLFCLFLTLPFCVKCHRPYERFIPVFLQYTPPYTNGHGLGDDASSLAFYSLSPDQLVQKPEVAQVVKKSNMEILQTLLKVL